MTSRAGAALERALVDAVGSPLVGRRPVGGGCINDAQRVQLADGRTLFVKTHPSPPPAFFEVEAAGLRWLAEAEPGLGVPGVVAVGRSGAGPAFLALEWIEQGRPARGTDESLGRGLAALHRRGAPTFGWDRDGFVGDLPQSNGALPGWAEFYGRRRIEPLARRAVDDGRLGDDATRPLERVLARLPELVGPEEAPARLHGDLWGGNLLVDAGGRPWLVDPAPYGGHREVDLAMMRLFGGFGKRVFAAYGEAHPLAPGWEERVALYQLYPLLVHVTLFGTAYANRRALAVLRRYA